MTHRPPPFQVLFHSGRPPKGLRLFFPRKRMANPPFSFSYVGRMTKESVLFFPLFSLSFAGGQLFFLFLFFRETAAFPQLFFFFLFSPLPPSTERRIPYRVCFGGCSMPKNGAVFHSPSGEKVAPFSPPLDSPTFYLCWALQSWFFSVMTTDCQAIKHSGPLFLPPSSPR